MAYIYKTKSGKWGISYGSGKSRVRRTIGSLAEAKAALGDLKQPESTYRTCTETVHGYLDKMITRCRTGRLVEPNTVLSYGYSMVAIRRLFPDICLDEVTKAHIADYIDSRREDGVKDSSINREIALLSKGFKWAVDAGIIPANPCYRVRLRERPAPPRALLPNELADLLEASGAKLSRIIRVSVFTGMRMKEVLELRRDDIQIRGKSGTAMVYRKWKAAKAPVPLPEPACEAITEGKPDGPWVFRGRSEGHMKRCISQFTRAAKRAGIPWATFHNLRDTFATNAIQHGMDLVTLKEILGHSKMDMVLRYAQIADPHKAMMSERTASAIEKEWRKVAEAGKNTSQVSKDEG